MRQYSSLESLIGKYVQAEKLGCKFFLSYKCHNVTTLYLYTFVISSVPLTHESYQASEILYFRNYAFQNSVTENL